MIKFKDMVCEIGLKTYEKSTTIPRAKMKSSEDSQNYFRQIWEFDLQINECMYAIFLNRANNVTKYSLISKGGTCGTVVDIKILLKLALETLSHSIILGHNHPSGSLKPSDADLSITKKIKGSCKTLDIQLLDHIILTEESYFSFSDEDIL